MLGTVIQAHRVEPSKALPPHDPQADCIGTSGGLRWDSEAEECTRRRDLRLTITAEPPKCPCVTGFRDAPVTDHWEGLGV